MVDSQRTNYFQDITLTPSGVVAGTYDFGNGSITVGEDGRITDAVDGDGTGTTALVADMTELNTLVSESDEGRLVVVLDAGNGYPALYYFDGSSFVRIGNDPARSVRYARIAFSTASSTNIGSPIPTDAIVKSVRLQILTPYTGGTTIRIVGQSGTVYMDTQYNIADEAGIYMFEVNSSSAVGGGDAQLQAKVIGGPGVGSAIVTVEYLMPV